MELIKRTKCLIKPPSVYGLSGCPCCGNEDVQWSEWERHLWCDKCQLDFVPESKGILDGPVPVELAAMLGMPFIFYNIETGEIEKP
jgi:hypothetical protein